MGGDLDMNDATLKWQSFPSRSPGGQQVGRPISGVLVTHEPTGISVGCTSERSQFANRKEALRLLVACLKIAAKEEADGR